MPLITYWNYNSDSYGMMGRNWGLGISQNTNNDLSEDEANKDIEDSLKNATIDKEKNTVIYSGEDIKFERIQWRIKYLRVSENKWKESGYEIRRNRIWALL